MSLDKLIQQIIASTPSKKIEGKKRLQKLVFLLQAIGINSGAKFFLKDYGPFSRDVENCADVMAIFGDIRERNIPTGYMNYMTTVYELNEDGKEKINKEITAPLSFFDKFRSVELEVASTIIYFTIEGVTFDDAVKETSALKPTKTNERTIGAAKEIFEFIQKQNVKAAHT